MADFPTWYYYLTYNPEYVAVESWNGAFSEFLWLATGEELEVGSGPLRHFMKSSVCIRQQDDESQLWLVVIISVSHFLFPHYKLIAFHLFQAFLCIKVLVSILLKGFTRI